MTKKGSSEFWARSECTHAEKFWLRPCISTSKSTFVLLFPYVISSKRKEYLHLNRTFKAKNSIVNGNKCCTAVSKQGRPMPLKNAFNLLWQFLLHTVLRFTNTDSCLTSNTTKSSKSVSLIPASVVRRYHRA